MQTITFSEKPFGTLQPTYYCKTNTISFRGEIVGDGAQPDSPVVAANSSYEGPIDFTFSKPVSDLVFKVGYFDQLSSTTVYYFDAAGAVIKSETNTQFGVQTFALSNPGLISRVLIYNTAEDDAGFSLDTISFRTPAPEVNPSGSQDIDGILWGFKWDHTNLTWSFPTTSAEYLTNGYAAVSGFQPLTTAQQNAYAKIIANFDAVCGLTFTKTTAPNADLRFAKANALDYSNNLGLQQNLSARGGPPDLDQATVGWGDSWFSYGRGTNYETPLNGDFAYAAGLMHELGHSVGLKHGQDPQKGHGITFPALPPDHDSQEYSVMTYNTAPGKELDTNEYSQTLMQNDIAALQYMYGADFSTNNGNTVYKWSTTNGDLFVNGVSQNLGTATNHLFMTIWDGGGNDTYDFSNYLNGVQVNLAPGEWSTTNTDQLADLGTNYLVFSYVARGNIANALLYQGNAASLIENVIGGGANDTIVGNEVSNAIASGAGNDAVAGGAGSDAIDGGIGNDTMFGGTGDDFYWVDSALDVIGEFAGEGNDLVYLKTSYVLADQVEYAIAEGAAGLGIQGNASNNAIQGNAGNNGIAGGAGNDYIAGDAGDDSLDGQSGADTLAGGSGSDTFFVDSLGDSVIETADATFDTVWSTVSFIMPTNVEIFVAQGGAAINALGNDGVTLMLGNNAANVLFSFGGSDMVLGQAGNDTIDGGAGSDSISGGNGGDILTGGLDSDYFIYTNVGEAGDVITDFTTSGPSLDILDLRSMFIQFTPGFGATSTSAIASGHLTLTQFGADVAVYVDVNGGAHAPGEQILLAIVQNVTTAALRPDILVV